MVVVVVTAAGALLVLRAYNSTKAKDPDLLKKVVSSVRQQTGVMAAICGAIFGVLSALEGVFKGSFGDSSSSLSGVSFGKRFSERSVIEQTPTTSVG